MKLTLKLLTIPGAGTMRLEMASSLIELSVGGGGQTRLSIISTFRLPTEIAGGSGTIEAKSHYLTFFNQ